MKKITLILFVFLSMVSPLMSAAQTTAPPQSEIVVGIVENPPFIIKSETGNMGGFSIDLIEEFSKRTGVVYSLREFTDWGNMINSTQQGIVDLSITNITITSAREKIMDYSQPIYDSGQIVLIRGKKENPVLAYGRLIWQSGILLFLGGALILLLVIAHLLWAFERNVKDVEHDYFRDEYLGGVWDAFWWAFVVMAMGGFEKERPRKVASRLLAMFWILLSLFFISTLTAKMTTAMTVNELSTGIGSVHDLPGKKVARFRSPGLEAYLDSLGISSARYSTVGTMYEDLESGKIDAIVGDEPILKYYAQTAGKGKVKIAGQKFRLEKYGALFPEGSELRESFDLALIEMQEDGTYKKILDRYFGEH